MAWLRRGGDAPPARQYVLFRYMAGDHCGRPYNARQLLLIPNSSFLIPNSPRQIPIYRIGKMVMMKHLKSTDRRHTRRFDFPHAAFSLKLCYIKSYVRR